MSSGSSVVESINWNFCRDLLSNLPLEISHQILGYLPLYQYFRVRRVSKSWFRMLSAPQTVEHLLRFWYPKAEAKLERSQKALQPTTLCYLRGPNTWTLIALEVRSV